MYVSATKVYLVQKPEKGLNNKHYVFKISDQLRVSFVI